MRATGHQSHTHAPARVEAKMCKENSTCIKDHLSDGKSLRYPSMKKSSEAMTPLGTYIKDLLSDGTPPLAPGYKKFSGGAVTSLSTCINDFLPDVSPRLASECKKFSGGAVMSSGTYITDVLANCNLASELTTSIHKLCGKRRPSREPTMSCQATLWAYAHLLLI